MDISEIFQTGYHDNQFASEKRLADTKNGDNFAIEDLLDIPNDECIVTGDGGSDAAITTESSNVTEAGVSCNSSFSTVEPCYNNMAEVSASDHFSSELCVPYDDMAELEWLSNFVEESFSTEDLQKMHLIQGINARTSEDSSTTRHSPFQLVTTRPDPIFMREIAVPAKARSKRPRAAPKDWTSRLLVVSPTPSVDVSSISSTSESDCTTAKKTLKTGMMKKKECPENLDGRRCLHCATDKTPQWRTGPMGPKTLCNACGVRYKSGRLVPEYRPASSPTFVLTKHSNSHRKVIELRRQKEMQRVQQHQEQFGHHPNMMFGVPNSEDYLIHQRIRHDYRHMI